MSQRTEKRIQSTVRTENCHGTLYVRPYNRADLRACISTGDFSRWFILLISRIPRHATRYATQPNHLLFSRLFSNYLRDYFPTISSKLFRCFPWLECGAAAPTRVEDKDSEDFWIGSPRRWRFHHSEGEIRTNLFEWTERGLSICRWIRRELSQFILHLVLFYTTPTTNKFSS